MRVILHTVVALTLSTFASPSLPATAQRRGDLAGAVDRYVQPLIELDAFSGVLLIARNDSVLVERAYGMADHELGVRMSPDHIFRIASISKSFTRALIGRLVDRGLMQLDDPLSRWIPDFPNGAAITIDLLLEHRAGVAHVNSLPYDEEAMAPNTLGGLVAALKRMPLDFAPGTARRYSNGGYALLAAVIERATGKSYGGALDEEILRPLGLRATGHQDDGQIVHGLVRGTMPSPVSAGVMMSAPYQQMATKTGGGSLVSSARDLHRWSLAIGRDPVLRRATWQRLFPNDTSFFFDGRNPGYMSALLRDRDITVVVLANNYAAAAISEVARAAAALANGRQPAALGVVAPTAASLDGLAGSYVLPDGALALPRGTSVEIRRAGDHLVAYIFGRPVDVLIPQGGRTFLVRSQWAKVTFDEPGRSGSMSVEFTPLLPGAQSFRSTRVSASGSAAAAAPADLWETDIIAIQTLVLRFYRPAGSHLRWMERSEVLTGARYDAVLETLGRKFEPVEKLNKARSGGLLRVMSMETLAPGRWRIIVQYRPHFAGFTGPPALHTFEVETRRGRFVIASRPGQSRR